MTQKFPSEFNTPSQSPGFLLWKVTHLWQRKQREALQTLDLTHVQFVLLASLAWLLRSETLVNQADVARHASTDEMMTSTVIRTLEKKKLLRRLKHPTDTRARILSLTAQGESKMTAAIKLVEQVDLEFFAQVDATQLAQNLLLLI